MRAPLLLALALVGSGCLGPGEPVDAASVDPAAALPDAPPLPVADENLTVEAPEWRAGDAWLVESSGGGETERATLVVSQADSSSYQMRTTSEQVATYDAMFDVSYVGRIRASDLAGFQGERPVQFFSFPLADGKAWTTTWDGMEISLRATFAPAIATPLGPQPGFLIHGTRADGDPHVEYDYVPALRWWSRLAFSEGYGIKVTGLAANWTGEYAVATAKTLLTLETSLPVAATPAGSFTVDPEQTTLALTMWGYASAHARGLVILDPDHQEHGGPTLDGSATPSGGFEVRMLPAKAGTWHVLAPVLHHPDGKAHVSFQQVAVSKVPL